MVTPFLTDESDMRSSGMSSITLVEDSRTCPAPVALLGRCRPAEQQLVADFTATTVLLPHACEYIDDQSRKAWNLVHSWRRYGTG